MSKDVNEQAIYMSCDIRQMWKRFISLRFFDLSIHASLWRWQSVSAKTKVENSNPKKVVPDVTHLFSAMQILMPVPFSRVCNAKCSSLTCRHKVPHSVTLESSRSRCTSIPILRLVHATWRRTRHARPEQYHEWLSKGPLVIYQTPCSDSAKKEWRGNIWKW